MYWTTIDLVALFPKMNFAHSLLLLFVKHKSDFYFYKTIKISNPSKQTLQI